MASKKRRLKEDLMWLKWPLSLLFVVTCIAVGLFVSANIYQSDLQRLEVNTLGEFDLVTGQVEAIAASEQIIVENIERFNTMVANSVMDEEDRVGLLQEIGVIRTRHQLFPMEIEISEQQRSLLDYGEGVEFPDEEISLRASIVSINLPMLHEGDLTNFLNDFLSTGRLIITSSCDIREVVLEERDLLALVPHQLAQCEFYWLTFKREPFETGDIDEFS